MSITRLRRKMQRSIRWIMLFFAVVFAVTAIFAFSPAMVSQLGAGGPEDVMARVNGEPIHRRDFEVRLAQQQEQMQTLPITLAFHFTRMTWQGMVDDILRQQGAQKLGVRISDEDVHRAVRERIEQFIQLRAPDASPRDKEELRQTLRSAVPFRRETVRQALLQERLAEALSGRARPVEIRVAHVLVSTDQRRQEQAYDIARSIAQQARTGRDFGQLARERSDDPGSKQQGGDVGWVKPDSSFVPEFIGAAFRLRVNEVSDPVRSRYGYHVIKVLEERPWKPTEPGSDKWDQNRRQEAEDQYRQEVARAIEAGFLAELRQNARIEPIAPFVKGLMLEEQAGGATLDLRATPPGTAPPDHRQQLLRQAAAAYEAALLEGGSETSGLEYHLAELYEQLKDWPQAEAAIKKALDRSDAPDLHLKLGDLYKEQKKNVEAVAAYQKAAELAGSYDQESLRQTLAQRFRDLGRKDLADEQQRLYDAWQKRQEERRRQEEARRRQEEARRQQSQPSPANAPANAPAANAPAPANAPARR